MYIFSDRRKGTAHQRKEKPSWLLPMRSGGFPKRNKIDPDRLATLYAKKYTSFGCTIASNYKDITLRKNKKK
jgi:hypothetical protein